MSPPWRRTAIPATRISSATTSHTTGTRSGAERLNWHWVSKVVQFPKFLNLGAFKIKADFGSTNVTANVTAIYGPYDLARNITDPGTINTGGGQLNCLGANMLGGQSPYNLGLVTGNMLPENRLPLGGSPLYPLALLNNQGLGVRMRVYCNGLVVSDQNDYRRQDSSASIRLQARPLAV